MLPGTQELLCSSFVTGFEAINELCMEHDKYYPQTPYWVDKCRDRLQKIIEGNPNSISGAWEAASKFVSLADGFEGFFARSNEEAVEARIDELREEYNIIRDALEI